LVKGEKAMTDTLQPPLEHSFRSTETDFRVGRVFNRTFGVLSRNLLPFCLVTVVSTLPNLFVLTFQTGVARAVPISGGAAAARFAFIVILSLVLYALSQATLLYAAFEDMRGRSVNLIESMRIGLRRIFSILGVGIVSAIFAGLASVLLVIPGLIVYTMVFVATPACVVEKLGPFKSIGRSAQLTKGNRWRIFGLWFVAMLVGTITQSAVLKLVIVVGGGVFFATICWFIWGAVFAAFYAVMAVVTYHDLRVAKEGVDTEQIAAVFD
jgi:hypothetical protein